MKTAVVKRLGPADREVAGRTFELMVSVFGEASSPLSDGYVSQLLALDSFWALAAFADGTLVGGLTAHTLPMTRSQASELFIYDLAVLPSHQRRGAGGELIRELRRLAHAAGISEIFVPADDEDARAFYLAQGGTPAAVTFFTFSADQ